MLHHMKYRFICIFKEKTTMFWSCIFSFILGTLFFLAFDNMSSVAEKIDVALVMEDNGTEATSFKSVLEMLGDSDEGIIAVKEMSNKEAKDKLNKDEISGIFYAGKEAKLVIAQNGIKQSVLQVILEQFQSRVNFISDLMKEKPEQLSKVSETIMKNAGATYVTETSLGGEKPDSFLQYYFALIAMACLFGAYMGADVSMQLQADVSVVGARRTVSKESKIKMVFCDLITISIIEFAINVLLICYLKYFLGLDIGDDWPRMLLIVFLGGLTGISVGVWIGAMKRVSYGVKIGLLTASGLISSFLSGLMIGGIKGLIEQYCPIINRINPASLITDAFYSISMYPDSSRYIRDILALVVLIAVLFSITAMNIRRVRYDSI